MMLAAEGSLWKKWVLPQKNCPRFSFVIALQCKNSVWLYDPLLHRTLHPPPSSSGRAEGQMIPFLANLVRAGGIQNMRGRP